MRQQIPASGTRLPARQLEKLVLAEIKGFLNSPGKVFEALDISNDDDVWQRLAKC